MYSVLAMVFGAGAAQQMLPCEASDAAGVTSISGFVSALQNGHGSKAHQLLYVNNRYCACDAASDLIDDLHERLLAFQHHGQDRLRDSDFKAAASGVRRFPAVVLSFTTHAASQSGTGADGAPDDRKALLRLLREALLSAWKDDVPDSFLQGTAGQRQVVGKQGRRAARRVGDPSEHALKNLSQGLPGKLTADTCRGYGAAGVPKCASVTVSDRRCRPLAPKRQLMSSEKRLAWHSGRSRCLSRHAMAADEPDDAAASLLQRAQWPNRPAQDTSFQRPASPAVDLPQDGGCIWASTARLCLSPAHQPKLNCSHLRQDAAAPQCSLPATAVRELRRSRSQSRAAGSQSMRTHELLEEVLTEDSATERLLRSAADAVAAEGRQQCTEMATESGSGAAAARRSASYAPAGSAATKKRGRRASWPSMAPRKRRAVHRNLPVGLRTVAPAHVASLPVTTSTSVRLGKQRKHAQISDVCENAPTRDATGNIGEQSHTLHDAHGWRQCKQRQAEPPHQQPAAPQPLNAILAAWQNPCIGRDAAEQDVLQLSDLAPGLAYLTIPQAVDRAGFMRARVLQQVRSQPVSHDAVCTP